MSYDSTPPTDSPVLPGAKRREQSVTSDWTLLRPLIHGVAVKEIRSVIKNNGYLTEIYRGDWRIDDRGVDQVFQLLLNRSEVEAWHVHQTTTDRFFVASGQVLLVLYDARADSPTQGMVNEIRLGPARPGLATVPPGVWHGVKNIGDNPALILNLVDQAYRYEAPDHWGLPKDSPHIPYRF